MPTGPRPIPPNGVAKIVLSGTHFTHKWAMVQYLQLVSSAPVVADLQSIVSSISSLWNTEFAGLAFPVTVLNEVLGVWYQPGPSEIVATDSTVHAGTDSGTPIQDAAACAVLQWHITAYYRGGHPRTYLPICTDTGMVNGSQISSSFQSLLHTAALGWLSGINALTHGAITACTLGTVSFQSGGAWRSPPLFRPFIGTTVNPTIGTQRRRILS